MANPGRTGSRPFPLDAFWLPPLRAGATPVLVTEQAFMTGSGQNTNRKCLARKPDARSKEAPFSSGRVGLFCLALIFFWAFFPSGAWSQTLELDGGETVFSQNSQFYFGQVGDFVPLDTLFRTPPPQGSASGHPDIGTAATDSPTLHLFVMTFYFTYETPGPPMTTVNSYNGLNPAAGIRVPFENGFWEGDAGIALAQAYQTLTPIVTMIGVYLQTEYYRTMGPGALDLFANYIGYIQYIYVQARYMTPVWKTPAKSVSFYLGPELIGQGNNTYNAGQGGAALGISLPGWHSYLTFDGGLLRSSVSEGWGGYEGFSWYVSF